MLPSARGSRAHGGENPRPDDRAHAQEGELHRAEHTAQLLTGVRGLADQLIKGLAAEKSGLQHRKACRESGLAADIPGSRFHNRPERKENLNDLRRLHALELNQQEFKRQEPARRQERVGFVLRTFAGGQLVDSSLGKSTNGYRRGHRPQFSRAAGECAFRTKPDELPPVASAVPTTPGRRKERYVSEKKSGTSLLATTCTCVFSSLPGTSSNDRKSVSLS